MTLDRLMKERRYTRYRLSKESGVPYSTISDLCGGKTELKKSSAETVYKLSNALGVSMEALLQDAMAERSDFELFKSQVCHRLKELGDAAFLIDTLERKMIRTYYDRKWYPESLYLLAMLDYVSRENDVPLCSDYDDLRRCRLKEPIFPAGILAADAAANSDAAKQAARSAAIPEFLRFNIIENDVRDVA